MPCLWYRAGLADLDREDADSEKPKKYALLVADTIIVPLEGQTSPEKEKESNLTQSCPKSWTEVAYFFKVQLSFDIQQAHNGDHLVWRLSKDYFSFRGPKGIASRLEDR